MGTGRIFSPLYRPVPDLNAYGAGMKQRKPYRPDHGYELSRIEAERRRLGITQQDLAVTAGMSLRTYLRWLKDGRIFGRHLRDLIYALRTIAAKQRAAERMFGDEQ